MADHGGISSTTWLLVLLCAGLWLFCVFCLLCFVSGIHDAINPLLVVPAGAGVLTWLTVTEWREDRRDG